MGTKIPSSILAYHLLVIKTELYFRMTNVSLSHALRGNSARDLSHLVDSLSFT